CDLDSDALEERRRRPEEEPVNTGLEPRGELADAAVAVGLTGGDELVLPELDADTAGRPAALDVEDVGRQRGAHSTNLSAWRRCSRAISSSSARMRCPSRTTSSPPTKRRS